MPCVPAGCRAPGAWSPTELLRPMLAGASFAGARLELPPPAARRGWGLGPAAHPALSGAVSAQSSQPGTRPQAQCLQQAAWPQRGNPAPGGACVGRAHTRGMEPTHRSSDPPRSPLRHGPHQALNAREQTSWAGAGAIVNWPLSPQEAGPGPRRYLTQPRGWAWGAAGALLSAGSSPGWLRDQVGMTQHLGLAQTCPRGAPLHSSSWCWPCPQEPVPASGQGVPVPGGDGDGGVWLGEGRGPSWVGRSTGQSLGVWPTARAGLHQAELHQAASHALWGNRSR